MDERIVCSLCFEFIKQGNKFGCPECQLFLHHECVSRFARKIDSCPFCERKADELKRKLDRKEVNAALNWVWWHMQEAIAVQMRLLRELDHKSATNQFETSEDFVLLIKRRYAQAIQDPDMDKYSLGAYRRLHEIAIREVEDFQRCKDCFSARHRYDEFDRYWICCVCTLPHLLVYAKLAKYPYWPAKVLANKRNSDEILCRFFGSQDESWISARNCYLLSEEYPADVEPKDKRYLKAKNEVGIHIKKLRKVYGNTFMLAPFQHPVNPQILYLFDEPMFCVSESNDHKEDVDVVYNEPLNRESASLQDSYSTIDSAKNDLEKQQKTLIVRIPPCEELERMVGKQNQNWYLQQFAGVCNDIEANVHRE